MQNKRDANMRQSRGEMVRYNCPFYEAENEKEVHFVAAWQEDLEPHTVKSEEKRNETV